MKEEPCLRKTYRLHERLKMYALTKDAPFFYEKVVLL